MPDPTNRYEHYYTATQKGIVFARLHWQGILAIIAVLAGIWFFYSWRSSIKDLGRWEQSLIQAEAERDQLKADKEKLTKQVADLETENETREAVLQDLYKTIRARDAQINAALGKIDSIKSVRENETDRIRTLPSDEVYAELLRRLNERANK